MNGENIHAGRRTSRMRVGGGANSRDIPLVGLRYCVPPSSERAVHALPSSLRTNQRVVNNTDSYQIRRPLIITPKQRQCPR